MIETTAFHKPVKISDPKFLAAIRALPCVVCGAAPPSTVSHIKTIGSGGDDRPFNCTPKCFTCHRDWEDSAPRDFCRRYPHFKEYLFSLGWFFDGFRLRHPDFMKMPVQMTRGNGNAR